MDQTNNQADKLKVFAQSPELAIFDMLSELNEKVDIAVNALKDLDLSKVDEIKGDKPEKGVDYFTEDEIEELKDMLAEQTTPVKGVHYFDGEDADVEAIKAELKAYIDEQMGNTSAPTEDTPEEVTNPNLMA